MATTLEIIITINIIIIIVAMVCHSISFLRNRRLELVIVALPSIDSIPLATGESSIISTANNAALEVHGV